MVVGGAGGWKFWYEALLIMVSHSATRLQLGIFWERLAKQLPLSIGLLSASKFANKVYR